MSTAAPHLRQPPYPKRHTLPAPRSLFVLFGGPLAWFLQLNSDFALASNPCFLGNELAPHLAHDWTWRAMIVIAAAGVLVALVSTFIARRAYLLTKEGSRGADLMEDGAGRNRDEANGESCRHGAARASAAHSSSRNRASR